MRTREGPLADERQDCVEARRVSVGEEGRRQRKAQARRIERPNISGRGGAAVPIPN